MHFGGKNLDFGFRFEIDLRALKFSILDFGTTKRGNRGRDVYISQVFDFECIKVFDFDFGTELSGDASSKTCACVTHNGQCDRKDEGRVVRSDGVGCTCDQTCLPTKQAGGCRRC